MEESGSRARRWLLRAGLGLGIAALVFVSIESARDEPATGMEAVAEAVGASRPHGLPPVSSGRSPGDLATGTTEGNVELADEQAALLDSAVERDREAENAHWRDADVEEIKQAIYELEIDSVADLFWLEPFVQTGDADTREYWNTDWVGVDDFKRTADGFHLEKADDGSLLFVPGEEAMRTYTFMESVAPYVFDETNQVFLREIDYYGKPIINAVKFLREDLLVTMVVSGDKVDLNIYSRDPDASD